VSLAAGSAQWLRAVPPAAARVRPKLLVLLVSEQFRSDYLHRVSPSLGKGGFRRLMRDGAYFPNCCHQSSTFTATGLVTLTAGCYPDLHGVIADRWYDAAARTVVSAGPESIRASTLAGQLTRDGRHRIFGVGMDGGHLAFFTGSEPTLFLSMGPNGQFEARGRQPAWLHEYNQSKPIENLHDAKWLAIGAGSDTPPLRVLRYEASRPDEFLLLYRSSPFGQMAEFEMARELIAREQLGQQQAFDLLVIVLGAMGQLGYDVGGNSPLMDQMVLQLDRQIEFTLELLNRTIGPEKYVFAFTAAHGAPPEPSREQRQRLAVAGEDVARAINRALSDRYDGSETKNVYVEKYVYPFLYLRPETLRQNRVDAREARIFAGRAAMMIRGVSGFYTADDVSSHHGEWLRRFRNSFYANRSGDVMLSYLPEVVEEFGAGRGISYGSLYNYDTHVPLFLYGPQFRPRALMRRIEPIDLAPTLAEVAGLSLPSSATGRVLGEVLKAEEPVPEE